MPAVPPQPSFDTILRLCDCFADRALGGRAVSICRRARDATFSAQAVAQFVIRLANVLAKNVSTGSLVAAQVAHSAMSRMASQSGTFGGRNSRCIIRRRGRLARD